jgi:hypothetical protein
MHLFQIGTVLRVHRKQADLPELRIGVGVTMPLFECTKCHVVDNTALTNFWMTRADKTKALCSQCDPEIGKWHGRFPRRMASEFKPEDVEFPVRGKS